MTCCHFWTEPDDGADRCAWCRHPRNIHRFVPCPGCHGWGTVPDPTDRTPGPVWARRSLPCTVCRDGGQRGGWAVRATGRAARDRELDAVQRNKPAG